MSVEIDPLELGFRRPFTVEVAQVLKIKNPNSAPVAFKVKTTAPKQYCVRPNSGRIEPGHEVEVSVLLQAMKQEPPMDAKCRDKFLVQSVTITGDKEFNNVSQIWDSVDRSAIQEKKIRVVWLAPSQDAPSQPVATPIRRSVANGYDATPDTAPPAYSSPQEDAGNNTTLLEDSTTTQAGSSPEPRDAEPATAPATQSAAATLAAAPAAVAASVKAAAHETYDDLADKLARAEATIVSLNKELAGGVLRQRKTAATSTEQESGDKTRQQLAQADRPQASTGTEGVPVQLVAVLCLLSFLLAYFFF